MEKAISVLVLLCVLALGSMFYTVTYGTDADKQAFAENYVGW